MKKLLLTLFLILPFVLLAQTYTYIDFGNSTTTTSNNWNNVVVTTQNQTGVVVNLIDNTGVSTGATLTLTDSFDHINANGTTTPNAALAFPASATRDSFFGATNTSFNGNANPTGGFTLTGLNPAKYYSFTVFSSRAGVTDNRETLYSVIGLTTKEASLNTSNNTSNTAIIENVQPTSTGEIIFEAKAGVNNNNSAGFYYLGAIELITKDSPSSTTLPDPKLTLTYPNGGHLWEVGKTVRLQWQSISITNLLIEFSSDNGGSWSTIATTPANTQYYDMVVPNSISSNCLVRVSGEGLSSTCNATFQIIPNDGVVYRIVVVGSSTAAGTGPTDINNAWVWRYRTYLTQMDTRYEVVNIALGGYATYNALPTGTPIPSGVNRVVDVERNITKAISLNANGIIINMPSNDAASGYPVADQLYNYSLIKNAANTANIPLWVTTPQPRNFGTNTTNLDIQVKMIQATYDTFGTTNTVDFWTDFNQLDNNGILSTYDSGDGIHMNDAAHKILFDRIVGKGIHTTVKNNVDVLSVPSLDKKKVMIYPNPFSSNTTITFNETINGKVTISIIDITGKEVAKNDFYVQNDSLKWSNNNLKPGMYIMKITNDSKTSTHKILIN